nr:LruC domain-containing protein [Pseudopedobacter sp.]
MKFSNILIFSPLFCALSFNQANAQTAPSFGAAESFAVLAATTITNTGNSLITGDIGVSPGTAITGFGPGKLEGGVMYSGALSKAGIAQADALKAYGELISLSKSSASTNLTGSVLGQTAGATTLKPGIYNFSADASLVGKLTLDDQGDPNALYIFTMGSTITTASYSEVVMTSGGKGAHVFWICGSATIGTYTKMVGNVIAVASITTTTGASSITMTNGASNTGRLIALNAAVTLDNNTASAVSAAPLDSDGDGVPDNLDDFPYNAGMAFNNFSSPKLGTTTAFEDNWPLVGDFDMNDLVMISKYNIITNAQNKVVKVIGDFKLVTSMSSYDNGFGVEFPVPRFMVDSVSGATLEAGQINAVIILFNNSHTELASVPSGSPKAYTVSFIVKNGPTLNQFGTDYNPFLLNFKGNSRREVHLIGKPPTALADLTVFGTFDDNSSVAAVRYYVTQKGLPYAINIPSESFDYPPEGIDISKVYLHFAEWAQSGGTTYQDWYYNLAPGYRN